MYELVSEYQGVHNPVRVRCIKHQYEFDALGEHFTKGAPPRRICDMCQRERREANKAAKRITVECAYCHQTFEILASHCKNSKHGLYFCCREHKDLAQSIESGEQFASMRPEHYGKESSSNYRIRALKAYRPVCSVCGWDEDVDILDVHHIDQNRRHNKLDNLVVLCPICHAKITRKKYRLVDRHTLVKIDQNT